MIACVTRDRARSMVSTCAILEQAPSTTATFRVALRLHVTTPWPKKADVSATLLDCKTFYAQSRAW